MEPSPASQPAARPVYARKQYIMFAHNIHRNMADYHSSDSDLSEESISIYDSDSSDGYMDEVVAEGGIQGYQYEPMANLEDSQAVKDAAQDEESDEETWRIRMETTDWYVV